MPLVSDRPPAATERRLREQGFGAPCLDDYGSWMFPAPNGHASAALFDSRPALHYGYTWLDASNQQRWIYAVDLDSVFALLALLAGMGR